MKTVTLHDRLSRARELHRMGYNCAQCVAMVFDDTVTIDADTLASLTAGLGGGVAATRNTCGCVTAMSMMAGASIFRTPDDKPTVYLSAAPLVNAFKEANGSVVCDDLRRPGRKSCMTLIEETISLLHNQLDSVD